MLKKFSFFLFLFVSITSCKKNANSTVPLTPVDITIYVNSPSYVNVSVVGGWAYITGGARGIIIYRKSTTEFNAYDRNCTYQSSSACAKVFVDGTGIIAKDTCCGSQFSIYDGSVINPPATLPLKMYNTSFDGTTLHIYN